MVCCSGWVGGIDHLKNLTVKRIPASVRDKCEYGKDDYSLTIAALQPAESAPQPAIPTVASATRVPPKKGKKPRANPNDGPDLFANEEAADEAN